MAKLSNEQRRALWFLAGSPNGCTEALMMTQGFESAMLGDLALNGLAAAVDHRTKPAAGASR
jgi:hypothetical protein